eukprot:COSAG01_NODE_55828_length_322_cov_1.134529_1_plen_48_part_10
MSRLFKAPLPGQSVYGVWAVVPLLIGDTTILQLTRASRLAGVAGFDLA